MVSHGSNDCPEMDSKVYKMAPSLLLPVSTGNDEKQAKWNLNIIVTPQHIIL